MSSGQEHIDDDDDDDNAHDDVPFADSHVVLGLPCTDKTFGFPLPSVVNKLLL